MPKQTTHDAQLLKMIRDTGLNPATFAKACGLSKATIYRGIRDSKQLSVETKYRITKVCIEQLGMNETFMMTRKSFNLMTLARG